jgi:DNA-binding GntR family transcriptional regulator
MSGASNERILPVDVYKTLREDILAMRLKSGAVLLERAIAERLGVSRTPVREALLRLEAEGLTRRYPKMGMVVTELTLRDVVEAFQIREFIEPPAAAEAANRLRPEEMAELLARFDELETTDLPDAEKYARHNLLDTKIHDLIIESLGNRRLIDLMDNIRSICVRARIIGTPIRFTQSTREHQELIRAIMNRDAAGAEQFMRLHLANTRQRLILSF